MEFYANDMKLNTPQLVIEAKHKSVAENDVVSEFLNECCKQLSFSDFLKLSKSEKKEWTIMGTSINTPFNKWMDDNNEPQPKRGLLNTRLESLGFRKTKAHGNVAFQGLRLLRDESDSDSDSD